MDLLLRAKSFLEHNRLATIATIFDNSPEAAVVYYTYDTSQIYFVTEKSTRKAENILKNKKIALVIVQEEQLEMLQIEGDGTMLTDPDERLKIVMQVFEKINKNDSREPFPAMKLHPKDLEAFRIDIGWFKYSNFAEETVVLMGNSDDWNKTADA